MSPAMNSLSKTCAPLASSVPTTNGDGPAPMFAYAEPLSAAVDGAAKRPLALVLLSTTTQLYQARPLPSKVTAGSRASAQVWPSRLRGCQNGGCPSPHVSPSWRKKNQTQASLRRQLSVNAA